MTAEVNNRAAVYGDFASLQKLKASAHNHDPGALRQVAQQFESLFARMMIKSMRKAIGTDPIFGSDQAQMYQGMFDDQLSLDMTRGKGLGLTDMLMRQLRGGEVSASPPGAPPASTAPLPGIAAGSGTPTAATQADRSNFIRSVWPQAQQAARELGVHPVGLVAQAALESNWGRSVPRRGSGESSHNLFGVKAGAGWSATAATAATREFHNGSAVAVEAGFRSYSDPSASFRDYVTLLSGSPRYREALHSGGDIGAFARGLQKGGYATDPDYATKVTAVAHQVQTLLSGGSAGVRDLKFSDSRPIADGTTAL